jgi:hypothetical protein
MKISTKHLDMARKLLTRPEERYYEEITIEDLWEEYWLEEGLVRARLTQEQIEKLASELKLDLSLEESWVTLEKMTMWL